MNQNSETNKTATQVGECEIVITRVFDAPRDLVFDAWTKEENLFPHFLATAVFEDLDGKTKLTYRTVFEENAAVFDKVKTYAIPGAEQTMNRLEEHLASMPEK